MEPTTLCAESTSSHFCHLRGGHSGGHQWSRTSPHNHLSQAPKPKGRCNGCDDVLVSS